MLRQSVRDAGNGSQSARLTPLALRALHPCLMSLLPATERVTLSPAVGPVSLVSKHLVSAKHWL